MPWAAHHTRVLVVDDEPVIAETLALILNQHGFQATPVYSGEMAIETAANMRTDVVITDVIMGGMNGIELAIRISGLYPDLQSHSVFRRVGSSRIARRRKVQVSPQLQNFA